MVENRCPECDKLLMKDGEIKGNRCKTIVKIDEISIDKKHFENNLSGVWTGTKSAENIEEVDKGFSQDVSRETYLVTAVAGEDLKAGELVQYGADNKIYKFRQPTIAKRLVDRLFGGREQ